MHNCWWRYTITTSCWYKHSYYYNSNNVFHLQQQQQHSFLMKSLILCYAVLYSFGLWLWISTASVFRVHFQLVRSCIQGGSYSNFFKKVVYQSKLLSAFYYWFVCKSNLHLWGCFDLGLISIQSILLTYWLSEVSGTG